MGNPMNRLRRRNPRRIAPVALWLFVSLLPLAARAADPLDSALGDPGRTYPNLVPNVVDVQVQNYRFVEHPEGGSFVENGVFLWFDTRAQNLGDVPMQLTIDEVGTPETSTVSQCVSWRSADAHVCRETELVGGFAWHDAHRHFHYQDFAAYELRRLRPNGRPDYSAAGLLRVAEKVSFCIVDSQKAREEAPPAPFYVACLPVVQGISAGYTDVYTSDTEGQNFSIEGIPNGDYALITELDYENTLFEMDNGDNRIEVRIRISDSADPAHPAGRKAEMLEKRWPSTKRHRPAGSSST